MNNNFERNALSWGEQGAEWLKAIPGLVKAYAEKWELNVQEPFPLNYNYVAPATRKDGLEVVLKIGFPADREFKTEIEALTVFSGNGMCKLLEADKEGSAILIERIVPGTPLSSLENDSEATYVLVEVIRRIHKPLPPTHNLLTLQERSGALPTYLAKYKDGGGVLPFAMVEKAHRLFQELIATSRDLVLVHGDLHHDNVLYSETSGWTGIDPKGVAAESAYEVAPLIGDPYETLKSVEDLTPVLTNRLDIFAHELNVDKKRLLDWCFAHSILSAVWEAEGSSYSGHMLRIAQALDEINS